MYILLLSDRLYSYSPFRDGKPEAKKGQDLSPLAFLQTHSIILDFYLDVQPSSGGNSIKPIL